MLNGLCRSGSEATNRGFSRRASVQINYCMTLPYIQEAFHVYLNKYEIVVTHLFFVILCKM